MVSLMVRVFTSWKGGQWIKSPVLTNCFLNRIKTSEYSEIYRELLTSERFPLYNYRSSTLRGMSRNICRLLRQCKPFCLRSLNIRGLAVLKERKPWASWENLRLHQLEPLILVMVRRVVPNLGLQAFPLLPSH